ncbi:TPA: citramalate synthase [bacterium]|nr:citramalate synthase [bacterium]
MMKIELYDTTLRDGAQMEGICFSLEDKLRIVQKLDSLGVHYIEGGWPGANPKDIRFFEKVNGLKLKNAKIVAFGSTRRAKNPVEEDANIKALLEAGTEWITIFGKSWDLHVRDVLKTSLAKNLVIISDSIAYLISKGKRVIYDAEHFFDGYKKNPEYALSTLKEAQVAGAEIIVLCDTNGGTMPHEIEEIVRETKSHVSLPLGIHAHNDSGMGVANSIVAIRAGCTHVQGTINGYGERCGNADLCSIIPNLKLKLKLSCINKGQLKHLVEISRFVRELANQGPNHQQPYVGHSAFSHKGGVHIDAVRKNPVAYEHIDPEIVGNHQHILVSELAGSSTILHKAAELKFDLKEGSQELRKTLQDLKELESHGYEFEAADASFELLVRKHTGRYKKFFDLKSFRVIVEKGEDGKLFSEATVKLEVNGIPRYTVAKGDGPVNALDNALREALEDFYPELKQVHLTDYKVRVIDSASGTAAKVRVLIESSDQEGSSWETIGVSENIIEASWEALVDSIEYLLLKNQGQKK